MATITVTGDIAQWLSDIEEAQYGRQVRQAIHDSILLCYSDVTSGKTTAETAATQANAATTQANAAAVAANQATQDANIAANNLISTFGTAQSYINNLNTKQNELNTTITDARTEINGPEGYVAQAAASAAAAETAKNAANTASQAAATANSQAALSALNAATSENNAATSATNAATSATNAGTSASEAAISATNAGTSATAASISAGVAETYRDEANLYLNGNEERTVLGIKDYYNSLVNTYHISDFTQNVADLLDFKEYVERPIDGYSATFAKYRQDILDAAEEISGYRDEINEDTGTITEAKNEIVEDYNDFIEKYNLLGTNDFWAKIELVAGIDDRITTADSDLSSIEERLGAVDGDMARLERYSDNIDYYYEETVKIQQGISTDLATINEAVTTVNGLSQTVSVAAQNATSALTTATSLTTAWSESTLPVINSNLSDLRAEISRAQEVTASASQAADRAEGYITTISSSVDEWNERKRNMDIYLLDVEASLAAMDRDLYAIDYMSVSSENVTYDIPASVTITDVTEDDHTHKNIHFVLRQGIPGQSNIVKGTVYQSLSDLTADITDPEVGDQYNVGSETPYNIYRWTGSGWEDQGPYGVSVEVISDHGIDAAWNNTTYPDLYMFVTGNELKYYTNEKLKPALLNKVDKVEGKDLSTNDFTNAYKSKVDENGINISLLQTNKVDKIAGKGLSTNDLTTSLFNKLSTGLEIASISELRTYVEIA